MIDPARRFGTGLELCRYVRQQEGDACILSFSCGKDSVGAWLQLRKVFGTIIPVYRYIVPGLAFVERTLAYYEKFFGTEILRYPNEAFLGAIHGVTYQTPGRARALYGPKCPPVFLFDMEEVLGDAEKRAGRQGLWRATGLRWADSLHRRRWITEHGPWKVAERIFYPIFDWRLADFERELKAARCKLPADYRLWNRSFDSPRYRFLKAMREVYPEDFERVRFWFPMIETEFKRREFAEAKREANQP